MEIWLFLIFIVWSRWNWSTKIFYLSSSTCWRTQDLPSILNLKAKSTGQLFIILTVFWLFYPTYNDVYRVDPADSTSARIFSDMHTGLWMQRAQAIVGVKKTPIGIVMYSDKTHALQNMQCYPVYCKTPSILAVWHFVIMTCVGFLQWPWSISTTKSVLPTPDGPLLD